MAAYALVAWTVLVWTTRIRNVVADDGGPADLVVPVGLTLLAIAALVDRRRGVLALAGATVVLWAVRVPLLLSRDHSVGFEVVHVVLAVVSIALAVLAARQVVSTGRSSVPTVGTSFSAPRRSS